MRSSARKDLPDSPSYLAVVTVMSRTGTLSLVLVASALLFTRSLNKLLTLDAGFNQENLLVARVNFRRLNIAPERRIEFKSQLLERIKAVPGVQAVAEADTLPLTGGGRGNAVWVEGKRTFRSPRPKRPEQLADPVIAGGKLYLRDQEVLLCYDVKAK